MQIQKELYALGILTGGEVERSLQISVFFLFYMKNMIFSCFYILQVIYL